MSRQENGRTRSNDIVLYDAEPGPSNGRPVDPAEKQRELEQLKLDESLAIQMTDEQLAQDLQNEEHQLLAENEASEQTWEVQTVLDKRVNPNTRETEYYLKWKDWDGSPTWEPESNCDCKSLINKFNRELKKRSNSLSQSISSQLTTPRKQTARKQAPAKRKANVLSSSSSSSATHVNSENSRDPTPSEDQVADALALVPVSPNGDTGRRRSSRLQKAVEIITLGDTSDTDNLDRNRVDRSSRSISPDATPRPRFKLSRQPKSRKTPSAPRGRPPKVRSNVSPPANRAKSPPQQDMDMSSCSEAGEEVDKFSATIHRRKLKLRTIVGAVNDANVMYLVVKWHGFPDLEKVPLEILRKFFCQEILDFLLEKIKWVS